MIKKINLRGGTGSTPIIDSEKKRAVKPTPLKTQTNGTSHIEVNTSLATQARLGLTTNTESTLELPKLDETLDPNEARKKIELFDKGYIKKREEKKEAALKIAQFLKVSYEYDKKVFDKHGKKSAIQINEELKTAKGDLEEDLKHALEMKKPEYKKNFFKPGGNPSTTFEKFKKMIGELKGISEKFRNDEEVIYLATFYSLKPKEGSDYKNQYGFMEEPPSGIVSASTKSTYYMMDYLFIDVKDREVNSAYDMEEFSGWDSFLRENRLKVFLVDSVSERVEKRFSGYQNGANPIIRKWVLPADKKWVGEPGEKLAKEACAWLLRYGVKVVDEGNKGFFLDKAKGLKWKEDGFDKHKLRHLIETCASTRNTLEAIQLGINKLKEDKIVDKELIGFGFDKNTLPVWKFRHMNMWEGERGKKLFRLALADEFVNQGLNTTVEDTGETIRLSFSNDDFVFWHDGTLARKDKKIFDLIDKNPDLQSGSRNLGLSHSAIIEIFFDLPDGTYLGRREEDIIANLAGKKYTLELDKVSLVPTLQRTFKKGDNISTSSIARTTNNTPVRPSPAKLLREAVTQLVVLEEPPIMKPATTMEPREPVLKQPSTKTAIQISKQPLPESIESKPVPKLVLRTGQKEEIIESMILIHKAIITFRKICEFYKGNDLTPSQMMKYKVENLHEQKSTYAKDRPKMDRFNKLSKTYKLINELLADPQFRLITSSIDTKEQNQFTLNKALEKAHLKNIEDTDRISLIESFTTQLTISSTT